MIEKPIFEVKLYDSLQKSWIKKYFNTEKEANKYIKKKVKKHKEIWNKTIIPRLKRVTDISQLKHIEKLIG